MNLTELDKKIDKDILLLNDIFQASIDEWGGIDWNLEEYKQLPQETDENYFNRVLPKTNNAFKFYNDILEMLLEGVKVVKRIQVHGRDIEDDIVKLDKEIDYLGQSIEKSNKLLSNDSFINRAKPEVVDGERKKLTENIRKKEMQEKQLMILKGENI